MAKLNLTEGHNSDQPSSTYDAHIKSLFLTNLISATPNYSVYIVGGDKIIEIVSYVTAYVYSIVVTDVP